MRHKLLSFIIIFSLGCPAFCNSAPIKASSLKSVPVNTVPSKPPVTKPSPTKLTSVKSAPLPPAIPPKPVSYNVEVGYCNKAFKIDSQKLFYLTLAGINANLFTINEIQSKSGYILFTAGQKMFLASVVAVDSKNSMLKIAPCNNLYNFNIGIVQNMFKYIDLNLNTQIAELPKV